MTATNRTYICTECGQSTTRRRPYDKSNVCFECGVAVAESVARGLALRQGPHWEAHQRNPGGRPPRVGP